MLNMFVLTRLICNHYCRNTQKPYKYGCLSTSVVRTEELNMWIWIELDTPQEAELEFWWQK